MAVQVICRAYDNEPIVRRVYVHAIFETATSRSDCKEARAVIEKMFAEEMANLKLFSVRVEQIEVEPMTEGTA